MAKPESSLPSIADLARYSSVNTIALYLGLLLFIIGAFGDISLSNKKLMLGAILICFSFAWRYFTRIPSNIYTPGEEDHFGTNISWGSAVLFVSFATATVVLIFASIQGRFLRCPLNLHR